MKSSVVVILLGQTLKVGDTTVRLVATHDNKVRLEVASPAFDQAYFVEAAEQVISANILMQDDHGWRRAIPRKHIENRPIKLGKEES